MKLSSTLNTAAASASRTATTPAGPCYLVVSGISRTFLPSDVEAALHDIGGTEQGAPRLVTKLPTVFAPLPGGYYNTPLPLTSTFHISFHSAYAAKTARLAIDRAPGRLVGISSKAPRHAISSRGHSRITVRQVKEDSTRWLLAQAANEWMASTGRDPHTKQPRNSSRSSQTVKDTQTSLEERSAEKASSEGELESALDEPTPASSPVSSTNYGELDTLSDYLSTLRWHNPAPFDPAKRTIQVLLRGLPGSATEDHVRQIGRGFKIDDTYGIFKVPKLSTDGSSIHIISLPSVSEAHRFVRVVHNKKYAGKAMEKGFMMRAEVIW
ncbi:hypothetical protein QFC24_003699 [Naganishia onofrii]|uniref:Uncharacterized protein n=1 Tax=Naganishia onofrii TaxID=1851511 RepID=A0ACC2XIS1_9TREE|nr:hypothetical protein QFC24_003699 [Naganishia onofrii]